MVEGGRLPSLGGDPRFTFEGFCIGFGAGWSVEWEAGPVSLRASAKVLVGLGTKPFMLVGGVFVEGELSLSFLSIGASGELVVTIQDDSVSLDGKLCATFDLGFFEKEGCVAISIGPSVPVEAPPPPPPLLKASFCDRNGFVIQQVDATTPETAEAPVWPDTVPVLEFAHPLACELPGRLAFEPGTPPAGPEWSGTSKLKYAYRAQPGARSRPAASRARRPARLGVVVELRSGPASSPRATCRCRPRRAAGWRCSRGTRGRGRACSATTPRRRRASRPRSWPGCATRALRAPCGRARSAWPRCASTPPGRAAQRRGRRPRCRPASPGGPASTSVCSTSPTPSRSRPAAAGRCGRAGPWPLPPLAGRARACPTRRTGVYEVATLADGLGPVTTMQLSGVYEPALVDPSLTLLVMPWERDPIRGVVFCIDFSNPSSVDFTTDGFDVQGPALRRPRTRTGCALVEETPPANVPELRFSDDGVRIEFPFPVRGVRVDVRSRPSPRSSSRPTRR